MLSEISIPLYIIYALQALFLPIQTWNYFARKSDVTRLRFLILLVAFICINISSLIPRTESVDLRFFVLGISGILTVIYTYYYVLKESGIYEQIVQSYFKIRYLLALIIVVEVIRFILTSFGLFTLTTFLVFGLHQIIIFSYSAKLILTIQKDGNNEPIHLGAFLVGCVSIFLPFVIDLLGNENLFWILVNLPFFIIAVAYFSHYLKQIKIESKLFKFSSNTSLSVRREELLNTAKSIDFSVLTSREQEIAQLIIEGNTYVEIAEKLFIGDASVRKHASNIFRKLKVRNLADFRRTYH